MPATPHGLDQRRVALSAFCLLGGTAAEAVAWQTILASENTATTILSSGLWSAVVKFLGGRMQSDQSGGLIAEVDFFPLWLVWLSIGMVIGLLASGSARRSSIGGFGARLTSAGFACGWWWLMGLWEASRLSAFAVGWASLESLLLVCPQLWQAVALAAWLTHLLAMAMPPDAAAPSGLPVPKWNRMTLGLIAVYVLVFTAMNWRLWFNLQIPHGDSAMYEEHLWNVWHGKGFRSYLDQGLFLGEHIQVIHLLLLPLHWLWPSHLMLELCESAALGIGAIPVFRMAARATGSTRAAVLMSAAYLLYPPLHFLDIEVDLKTFRPESFCVPFFLFAFDALESGRWRRALILLAIALSAKEDYSLIVAPLGIWIASTAYFGRADSEDASRRCRQMWLGGGVALFGVVYLLLATRVVIPYFRDWQELHYVKYFSKFGKTMSEVVGNMLTNPSLLFGELLTMRTTLFGLAMLIPIGCGSLLSPSRLAVGVPLFAILSLNELAADPRHHFHAPLVPIIFWSASVGVANARWIAESLTRFCARWLNRQPSDQSSWQQLQKKSDSLAITNLIRPASPHPFTLSPLPSLAASFVALSALACGWFFSMSPTGLTFWDPHSQMSLWRMYAADPAAAQFDQVLADIPLETRVASTDFVHPRFTHHARSYDYSQYRRRVAGYEARVPDDTDFIVIDTRHRYSDIKTPDQVREFREEPDRWELLPDKSQGAFIVLRRRR